MLTCAELHMAMPCSALEVLFHEYTQLTKSSQTTLRAFHFVGVTVLSWFFFFCLSTRSTKKYPHLSCNAPSAYYSSVQRLHLCFSKTEDILHRCENPERSVLQQPSSKLPASQCHCRPGFLGKTWWCSWSVRLTATKWAVLYHPFELGPFNWVFHSNVISLI